MFFSLLLQFDRSNKDNFSVDTYNAGNGNESSGFGGGGAAAEEEEW